MCWSSFLKSKSDTTDKIIQFAKILEAKQYIIKIISCYNAGIKQRLQGEHDEQILNI